MNENEFWSIIERAIKVSENDPEEKEEALTKEINKLTPTKIFEFAKLFDEKDSKAYSWNLWGAAYIINGGCGDDSFMDFRASLICMGEKIYEAAINNPDTLADVEFNEPEEDLFFEGYQYIAFTAYEDKTEEEMPDTKISHPENPEGEEWSDESEDDLRRICPKLYEKYSV